MFRSSPSETRGSGVQRPSSSYPSWIFVRTCMPTLYCKEITAMAPNAIKSKNIVPHECKYSVAPSWPSSPPSNRC
ncbi:hypothetical protein AB205_0174170 [Aquarana catesbeiana]|uniref:Uncharacterized protein n=1 Tax=Aquarana catesbeiana TaxID=8400 RepID=A0A2G9S061_AQUCT|nr:hypothetical protein AB205_0174170 [Aquarana catesbeiana]